MSIFKTKEEYLRFISAWKYATNHSKCHPIKMPCDHVQYESSTPEQKKEREALGYIVSDWKYIVPNGAMCKKKAWLQSEHYLLHNIVLGKDYLRGFCKKTIARKICQYYGPWEGTKAAFQEIEWYVRKARKYVEVNNAEACEKWVGNGKKSMFMRTPDRTPEKYYAMIKKEYVDVIDDLLEPLSWVLTLEDIAGLDLGKITAVRESLKDL